MIESSTLTFSVNAKLNRSQDSYSWLGLSESLLSYLKDLFSSIIVKYDASNSSKNELTLSPAPPAPTTIASYW